MNSLYVHIPFCERKCLYCSFVVSIGQEHRMDDYLACLQKEAKSYQGNRIQTIYIGGGTPTLMSDQQLERLFQVIHTNFLFSKDAEWTIEANPEGLSASKLQCLKDSGINRISLGVQSLNNRYLKYLGRNHNAAKAKEVCMQIRKAGFDNINVDLMFAFPQQSLNELKEDVQALIQLGSDHVSLYALTVEPNSRFFAQNIALKDDLDQAKQYTTIGTMLSKVGFEQYEVSNFAKPLKASRHNVNYWEGGHYIGLGVGAHSYLRTKRSWNVSRIHDYISNIQKGLSITEGFEELTVHDQMKEAVLFGLRMNRGIDPQHIQERFGCFLDDDEQDKVNNYIDSGLLEQDNGYVRASPKGRLVLDEICARLI